MAPIAEDLPCSPVLGNEWKAGRLPYLIVRLKQQLLAISSASVRQLLIVPDVVAVPGQPTEVRGMINVRGDIMPLVDLRVQLGMTSLWQDTAQTIEILQEREQDHKNWLAELQASVDERRPFKLARDPHQCKFGKWYDTYRPDNQSVAFLSHWQSFAKPHARIHAIADRVCQLADRGDFSGANGIIEAARHGELLEMIGLFGTARNMLKTTTREVAIVLRQSNRQLALSADEVVAVEALHAATVESCSELAGVSSTSLTPRIARRHPSGQIVLVTDADRLFEGSYANVGAEK